MRRFKCGTFFLNQKRLAIAVLLLCTPILTECAWKKFKDYLSAPVNYSFIVEMPDCIEDTHFKESLATIQNYNYHGSFVWQSVVIHHQDVIDQANLQIKATISPLEPPEMLKKIIPLYYTSINTAFLS